MLFSLVLTLTVCNAAQGCATTAHSHLTRIRRKCGENLLDLKGFQSLRGDVALPARLHQVNPSAAPVINRSAAPAAITGVDNGDSSPSVAPPDGLGVSWPGGESSGAADGLLSGEAIEGAGVSLGVELGPSVGAGVAEGVVLGVAVADGVGVGDDEAVDVGVGETQFGSMSKRTTRCSMYSSKCTTRQYMTYEPGTSAGMSVRRIRVQV